MVVPASTKVVGNVYVAGSTDTTNYGTGTLTCENDITLVTGVTGSVRNITTTGIPLSIQAATSYGTTVQGGAGSGALTLTGNATSTWSTTAGQLNVSAAAGNLALSAVGGSNTIGLTCPGVLTATGTAGLNLYAGTSGTATVTAQNLTLNANAAGGTCAFGNDANAGNVNVGSSTKTTTTIAGATVAMTGATATVQGTNTTVIGSTNLNLGTDISGGNIYLGTGSNKVVTIAGSAVNINGPLTVTGTTTTVNSTVTSYADPMIELHANPQASSDLAVLFERYEGDVVAESLSYTATFPLVNSGGTSAAITGCTYSGTASGLVGYVFLTGSAWNTITSASGTSGSYTINFAALTTGTTASSYPLFPPVTVAYVATFPSTAVIITGTSAAITLCNAPSTTSLNGCMFVTGSSTNIITSATGSSPNYTIYFAPLTAATTSSAQYVLYQRSTAVMAYSETTGQKGFNFAYYNMTGPATGTLSLTANNYADIWCNNVHCLGGISTSSITGFSDVTLAAINTTSSVTPGVVISSTLTNTSGSYIFIVTPAVAGNATAVICASKASAAGTGFSVFRLTSAIGSGGEEVNVYWGTASSNPSLYCSTQGSNTSVVWNVRVVSV